MTQLIRGFLLLAVIASMCFVASCSNGQSDPGGAKREGKLRIGIAIPSATHKWAKGVNWWTDRVTAMYPDTEVEFVIERAKDYEEQVKQIEAMFQKDIHGLVLLAMESGPVTGVARKAKERGIYIVNVDRGLTEPVADVFLEGDNQAFGREAAEFIVNRLNGKGNVVILRGMATTVDTDRYQGAMAVFNRHPGIKIVAEQPGEWSSEKAQTEMEKILERTRDIDAVWAADDDMALGCERAIRKAGLQDRIWLVGGGGMKEVIAKIMNKDPMYPATVTYSPNMVALAIHLCVSNMRDGHEDRVSEFMPRHIPLPVELVTPENAARFYVEDEDAPY